MKNFYKYTVFKFPVLTIILSAIFIVFISSYSSKLEIDASSQTLLLENDDDLNYFREVSKKFGTSDIIMMTFKPNYDLLDDRSLQKIDEITKDIEKLPLVKNVTNILNVPLFESPVMELADLVNDVRTLKTPDIDKNLVREEFKNSPIYKGALVSKDLTTTALIINLKKDEKYLEILNSRNELLFKENRTKEEDIQLAQIEKEFKAYRDEVREKEAKNIQDLRDIITKYENEATIFIGGASMIASDVIGFIKNDLAVYGIGLVLIFIVVLWIIFREVRWILVTLGMCLIAVVVSTGLLGYFGWEVTVLSSNFIALQLILTISIVLHLVVRYRELVLKYPLASQYKLLMNTILSKLNPSLFAVLTTMVGFASLVLSNIKPVIDLGWMISSSILVSLVLSFILFPAVMLLLGKSKPNTTFEDHFTLTKYCASVVIKYPKYIYATVVFTVIVSFIGIAKVDVENSFINYFKKSTDIYQGMEVIDRDLGGTTPLDVIVKFKDLPKVQETVKVEDEFSEFEDEFANSGDEEQYWFTPAKMELLMKVHNYLEGISHIGNVQSFATMLKVGRTLNNGNDLDSLKLALIYTKLPSQYRDVIVTPYINIEANEVRFFTRVIDSDDTLKRDKLIKQIYADLGQIIPQETAEFRVSNLMVLYNNMLQSLFDSQIKTIGFVIGVIFVMFIFLFRNFTVAFIAIFVNVVPIGIVFAIMGIFNIPLDIMTITIAAISIGIGVDDTIHYIHRFKEELKVDHDYTQAMIRSHRSIGFAMYYTTVVVIAGFSILVLSNLVPTIYFGLLTVLVMATMLTSALILLPRMLIALNPYGQKYTH
ncbi:MAG: MMPL family transporter [Arcobacteraceae bacterium]|jgi:predicted RND superfamily exporter protein|nr:MMPL family transporter [Arcobacteraceae bacterium]